MFSARTQPQHNENGTPHGAPGNMPIAVSHLHCCQQKNTVLTDICFSLAEDTLAAIIGPSGSGKTTLLRAIAGLQRIESGNIHIKGRCVASKDIHVPTQERAVAMVFQQPALFPHITVADNIAFGLRQHTSQQRNDIVKELLADFMIDDLRSRYPATLSGGQYQRVAIARVLAIQPIMVLLDEPFSHLEPDTRYDLCAMVKEQFIQRKIASILVTHEQNEASLFASQIGIIADGRLQQWDHIQQLYARPANRFVGQFVGGGTFVPGEVISARDIQTECGVVSGEHRCGEKGTAVEVLVRPYDVYCDQGAVTATISNTYLFDDQKYYSVLLPSGLSLRCVFPATHTIRAGDNIPLRINPQHLIAFPRTL